MPPCTLSMIRMAVVHILPITYTGMELKPQTRNIIL